MADETPRERFKQLAAKPASVADVGAALHEVLAASMRAWAGQFRRLAVLGGAKWDR